MAFTAQPHFPGTRSPAVPNREPKLSAIDYLALERDRETQVLKREIELPLPELVRNSFTSAVAESGSELAFACEDLLGYSALRRSKNLPGSLGRALAKLEIEFLDNGSVIAYKTVMLKRQKARAVSEARYDHIVVDRESAEVPLLREGLLKVNTNALMRAEMRVQRTILQRMLEESEMRRRGQVIAVDPVAPGLMDVVRWNVYIGEQRVGIMRPQVVAEIGWKTVSLRGYEPPAEMPVPEFILQKAASIKRECASADFYVEELRVNKVLVDPFLIAVCGDEQFYIDVWGEPEFEAGMPHNQI